MPELLKSRLLYIYPLNTSENIQKWELDLAQIECRLGRLVTAAVHVPIYLVNSLTIDCICPPRPHYSLERLAKILKDWPPSEEDDIPFERLEKAREHWWHVAGCYVSNIKPYIQKAGLPEELLLRETGPAIFLCPERIREEAEEKNLSLANSFEFTLFHELGHAYMKTPSRSGIHQGARDVWEESLANCLAVEAYTQKFNHLPRLLEVLDMIRSQPAEYQGAFPLISDSIIFRDILALLTKTVLAGTGSGHSVQWQYSGTLGGLIHQMMDWLIDLPLILTFLPRIQQNIMESIIRALFPYSLDITTAHGQSGWQPYFIVFLRWWMDADRLMRQHSNWTQFFEQVAKYLLRYITSGVA